MLADPSDSTLLDFEHEHIVVAVFIAIGRRAGEYGLDEASVLAVPLAKPLDRETSGKKLENAAQELNDCFSALVRAVFAKRGALLVAPSGQETFHPGVGIAVDSDLGTQTLMSLRSTLADPSLADGVGPHL